MGPFDQETEDATETMTEGGVEEPGQAMPSMPEKPPVAEGIFDQMDALDKNPPTPEGMAALISETDRIEAKLQDDPAPEIPTLLLKDEELQDLFGARLREAAHFRAVMATWWLTAFCDYNQKIDPSVNVWRSKIKLPYVRALVLSAIPSGISAMFDSGPLFPLKPQRPEFTEAAQSMQDLLQWQSTVKTQTRKAMRHFLHYRGLYGTGIWKDGWLRQVKPMLVPSNVYDDLDENGRPLPEGQQGAFLGRANKLKIVEIHDEPEGRAVDIFNAFPCPWTELGCVPYMIERVETHQDALMNAARTGALGTEAGLSMGGEPQTPEEALREWFKENPNHTLTSGTEEYAIGTRSEALQQIGLHGTHGGDGAGGTEKEPGKNPVIVYEYWTDDVKIVFAGDGSRRILGKQPNPYLIGRVPYVFSQYDEIIPGFVWGCGIGMAAGPIQKQLDFDVNHANDGRRLALNPVLKRKKVGSSLMGDITIKPGAVVDVREMTDLEPLVLNDKTMNALEWQSMLVGFGDRATGIGDLQRGLGDAGVNTATEAQIVDSNAITRKLGQVFELRDFLQEVGRIRVALNKQFFDKETMVRISGKAGLSWKTIKPEEILGEFDVVPAASMTRSDVVLQRRDWNLMYPQLLNDPLINQHELKRRYLTAMDVENVDDLLQPPPPPAQDPMDEEILLRLGLNVPVSPEENFQQHLQVHGLALQALKAEGAPDTRAIAAHEHHIQETMQMMAMAQQQMLMGASAAAGAPPSPGGAPRAGKTRDKATMLGQAQGSDGEGGESPGPMRPPGRPSPKPKRPEA